MKKNNQFFAPELKLNLNLASSNFAVRWDQERGLPGRIMDQDFLNHDDEPQKVLRKRFLTANDVSQDLYDRVFSSETEIVEEETDQDLLESLDGKELNEIDDVVPGTPEKKELYCHHCSGAISVAVEKYEGFQGEKIEDLFEVVEVKSSPRPKKRIPLCRACNN